MLAAGGSVGIAYHGGVLAALEESTGWDPRGAEVVIGTSAGSLTGAMLRAGVPAGDLAGISEGLPLSPEGARLAELGRPRRPRARPLDALALRPFTDPAAVLAALARPSVTSLRAMAVAALPSGAVRTEAISDGIDAVYGGRWPDRPLWICSYDVRAGRRVVFGRDEVFGPHGAPEATVGQAVAASCAIPMYFRPVVIGGRRFVDGGVHSMVNLDLAAGVGLDLVIAVSPLSQAVPWGLPSPAALMRQPLRARLRAEMEALRRQGVPVVAIQPGRTVSAAMGLNPMDAARRTAVSRTARDGVRRWLRDGLDGRHLARILSGAAAAGVEGGTAAGQPQPDLRRWQGSA